MKNEENKPNPKEVENTDFLNQVVIHINDINDIGNWIQRAGLTYSFVDPSPKLADWYDFAKLKGHFKAQLNKKDNKKDDLIISYKDVWDMYEQ